MRTLEHTEVPAEPESLRPSIDELVHEAFQLQSTVLARRIDALDGALEQLRAEVEAGLRHNRIHTEEAVEVAERKLTRRIDLARRAALTTPEPVAAVGQASPGTSAPLAGVPGSTSTPSVIEPGLYVALEDRFRGDPAVIEERQRTYLPYLEGIVDAEHPVLDVGCGRGEWLRVLGQAGIAAAGIDTNPVAVAECREAGLDVVEADLVDHLAGLGEGSLGALTLFQVVEHLPFDTLVQTLRAAARVLRPGGVLLAETPNGQNLRVGASTFWIDPTHQRPLHPEVLVFLAVECGFTSVERLFVNPLGPEPPDLAGLPEPAAELLHRLAHDVDGPGDFTLIARTPDPASS